MYEIVEKKQLAESIYFMNIKAPRVAKAAKPGQFIIAKIDEKGERIPLTICNYDEDKKIMMHLMIHLLLLLVNQLEECHCLIKVIILEILLDL